MKIVSLASGSKANCYYIASKKTSVLVDIGLNTKALDKKSKLVDIDLKHIDAVLVTHSHTDHILGVAPFVFGSNTKLYCHEDVATVISGSGFIDNNYVRREDYTEQFVVGDILVEPFRVSHDSGYTVGYVLRTVDDSAVIMTDTGFIGKKMFKHLENVKTVMLESNHDVNMLLNGTYPPYLKSRILSDVGHLSNDICSKAVAELAQEEVVQKFVLCHLSEHNNTENLAYNTSFNALKKIGKESIPILVATQNQPLIINEN